MLKLIATVISGLIINTSLFAQDCMAKFEVNAGPDIDVCENGIVGLNGIIGGDATEAVWRGGKGTFSPDRKTLNAEYTPAPEEIGSGVVLVLVANNPKLKCTPARSEIKVTVNSQPKANAGENMHACEGMPVQLKGSVTGKTKQIIWQSNGSGKFDNPEKTDAKYLPSEKDIKDGGCSINLIAIPFGVCLPDTSTMILMIDRGPEFVTDAVKPFEEGKAIKLGITTKETTGRIDWKTEGSGTFNSTDKVSVLYTPSVADIAKDKINIQVAVTDKSGVCTIKKDIPIQLKKVN